MAWLFARPLRPFVLLAGAASLALNLALLAPALYMVQVFDRVFASRSVETLDGGEGDDVIIGSAGVVIQGFQAGAGSQDVVDLRGIAGAQDFAWVLAHASDVDGNAVLDLGSGEHVTIESVSVGSLHSDDFLLG
jgi:Ca2+-binding RTX toxin-like protein